MLSREEHMVCFFFNIIANLKKMLFNMFKNKIKSLLTIGVLASSSYAAEKRQDESFSDYIHAVYFSCMQLMDNEKFMVADITNSQMHQESRFYSINGETVKFSDLARLKRSAQKLLNLICYPEERCKVPNKINMISFEEVYDPEEEYKDAMNFFMNDIRAVDIGVVEYLMKKYQEGVEANRRQIWRR